MNELKKNIGYFKNNFFVDFGLETAAFFIGAVIAVICMGKDAGTTIVPMGSILAIGTMVMTAIFSGCFTFMQQFNLAVAMGCTRRKFLTGYLFTASVFTIAQLVFLYVANKLEISFYTGLYPASKLVGDIGVIFYPKLLVLLVLIFTVFRFFTGMIVLHFGKTGFFVLWGAYMLICVGGSRVSIMMERRPDGLCADFVNAVMHAWQSSTNNMRYIIGYVIVFILFLFTILMARRQEVKNS